MPPTDDSNPTRTETDRSLKVERDKTDFELAGRRATAEQHSDAVIDRARDKADAVLQEARSQADELAGPGVSATDRAEIIDERDREDDMVEDARMAASESLERERAEQERALRDLLAQERDETNVRLVSERADADKAVLSRDDSMAMVSHDLRGMLGGIALHASMLATRARKQDDQETLGHATGIQRFTARMSRLIGDLVDVASFDSGQLKLSLAPHDAEAFLKETFDALLPDARAKRLTLTWEGGGAGTGRFDRDRIQQVLGNLAGNAFKFTPAGGTVSLRAERVEGALRFSVTDTGGGIDEAAQASVFKRFWQADDQDRRGMGLGLYISQRIVEAHGGVISVKSGPGGSTFSFTLPLTN